MSNEEINQAIAEICGWTDIQRPIPGFGSILVGYHPKNGESTGLAIPYYIGDLNAMHDAFKTLGTHWEISQVHDGYYCRIEFGPRNKEILVAGLELLPVMAESFLRALGKWKEGV